jgi:hypothetical protein
MALLADSPAANVVPLASCLDAAGDPLSIDQRGLPRPSGSACDIGAYEVQ